MHVRKWCVLCCAVLCVCVQCYVSEKLQKATEHKFFRAIFQFTIFCSSTIPDERAKHNASISVTRMSLQESAETHVMSIVARPYPTILLLRLRWTSHTTSMAHTFAHIVHRNSLQASLWCKNTKRNCHRRCAANAESVCAWIIYS